MSIIAGAAALRYLKGPQEALFKWPLALMTTSDLPILISNSLVEPLYKYLSSNGAAQQGSSNLNERYTFKVLHSATKTALTTLCYATGLSQVTLRLIYKIYEVIGRYSSSVRHKVNSETLGHFRNLTVRDVALFTLASETVLLLNEHLYTRFLGQEKASDLLKTQVSYDQQLLAKAACSNCFSTKRYYPLFKQAISPIISDSLQASFALGGLSGGALFLQSSTEDLVAKPIAYALNRSEILPKFNGHPRFIVTSALARGVSLAIFAYAVERLAPKVVEDMGKQVFKLGAARIAINLLLEGYLTNRLIAMGASDKTFNQQGEVVTDEHINEVMFGPRWQRDLRAIKQSPGFAATALPGQGPGH